MGTDETSDNGVVRLKSPHSVEQTVARLKALLSEHGVMTFAHIDFSGDAARAGLTLAAEQMLIFGNPKAGTPLMQAVPASGLDLPLKALIYQDGSGSVLAYNDPQYIVRRHRLPANLSANIAALLPLLQRATAAS
jgi:uncharacterized protein (DUF302 family)